MRDLMIGVIPILAAGLLGWLVLRALGGKTFASRRWVLAFPIGSGLLTFGLFCMSWGGVRLSLLSVAGLTFVLVALMAVLAFGRRDSWPQSASGPLASRPISVSRALVLAALGLVVLAAVGISVARSYSSWDGMAIWSVKGYGIAREGTVRAGAEWGSHGLAYPLNIPLQVAVFALINGDALPHSKLVYPLYYLSLLGGLLGYLRNRIGLPLAGLVCLLIGAAPIVFDQATNGYANLAFSAYLVLGLLALLEGAEQTDRPLQWIGGLLLGLATWTRPEGLYLALAGAGSVWLASRLTRSKVPAVAAWASPILMLAMPWTIFSAASGYQHNTSDAVVMAWASWKQLDFHPADLYRIFRYLGWQSLETQFWGLAIPALAVAVHASAGGMFSYARRLHVPLLAATVAIFLAVAGYFYMAGYQADLEYLLSTSVERVAMPGMILGLVWLGTLLPLSQSGMNEAAVDSGAASTAAAVEGG